MDSNNFLPFALPDIGEEEIREVVDSLRSGWLTTGPKTKRFEEDFAAFLGNGVEAIAVNSATAGLHLALEALGIGPGDEVITTPYTFTATAEVIRYLGAHPVFVDIDTETLNIDPEKLEEVIGDRLKVAGKRIKAIIPVHFGGLACDMDPIMAIAGKYDVKVIEDAAHALPTTYMAAFYDEAFRDLPVVLPPKAGESDVHAWHLYIIRLKPEVAVSRDRFIELMAEKGIGCSVHFIPLHLQPYWRDTYNLKPQDFPNALSVLSVYEKAVSLPLYTKMTEKDQKRVVEAVREILEDYDNTSAN